MYVVNRTRGTYLGVAIKMANSLWTRLRGLYARREIRYGDGLWLVPCDSIQTVGLRFAIDVVFLDGHSRVVKVAENVPPGRFVWCLGRAHSALEVPAGVIRSSETQVGDRVEFVTEVGVEVS